MPLPLALLLLESQALQRLRWHLPTGWVAGVIPRRPERSARGRRGGADPVHASLTTPHRTPAPSLGNRAAQPGLELVPLPRPRWQGADREAPARLLRQPVPRPRPQAAPAAGGATAISRDEKPFGF